MPLSVTPSRSSRFSRVLLLVVGVLAVSACGQPKTRAEFKQLMLDNPTLAFTDTYITTRRFEDVVQTLDRKWKECYSGSVTQVHNGHRLTDNYSARTEKISSSLVELSVQDVDRGTYSLALNVERLPANKTKLTWYSSKYGGKREAWEMNKQWSDGKNVACR